MNNSSIKIRNVFLIYISVFFIVISQMNFPLLNVLHGNAPSRFLCILFCVSNFDLIIKRIKWKLAEIVFFLLWVCSCFITLVINETYEYNSNGFLSSLSGYALTFLVYVAFRLFFVSITKERKRMLLKAMFWGYVFCMGTIGLLEAIYIYIYKSPLLYNVLDCLIYRSLNSYLTKGRIQFWSEPSFASVYLLLIYIPAAVGMYKNSMISKRKLKNISLILIFLNVLTLSGRFFIDAMVFLLIYFLINGVATKNRINKIVFILILLFSLSIVLFSDIVLVTLMESNIEILRRIGLIVHEGFFSSNDYSLAVRIELMRCALMAFISSPIVGYGMGNFLVALKQFYKESNISNWNAKNEMLSRLNSAYDTSYSFYTTTICQSGLFGAGMIICVGNLIFKGFRRNNNTLIKTLCVMLIYILIQNEITCLPFIFWFAIINSNAEKIFISSDYIGECSEKNIDYNDNI